MDDNTFSIFISSRKYEFYNGKTYLFQSQYHGTLKFLYPFYMG